MKTILMFVATVLLTNPAMAFELYHCAVIDVTDGYFNTIDLKVDGTQVTGYAEIRGAFMEIGKDLVGATYEDEAGKTHTTVIYQEGRELTESISFLLPEVTSKRGPATRYTAKEGFGVSERPVDMICDMAEPL